MFKDRILSRLGGNASGAPAEAAQSDPPPTGPAVREDAIRRHSPGLEQFIASIRDEESLSLLDLAGATQANISFLTNLGHRVYSDDILHALDSAFGSGPESFENQGDPARVEQFTQQTLDFPNDEFGGGIVWDTLQFLAPPLLQMTVEQLYHVLKPGACLLAFFHADEKQESVPLYSYRIADTKTVLLAPRGKRRKAQFFNNRNIEKLFSQFSSVKFFLTRDHLREVIVKR